ncbi:nitroreductase [Streptomyces sp. NBC_01363]|uniref:Acg family FMN-binding oxidoreductase n=1 Tax=Streptomyces sp. NBC_01363 TaxID=2903840 RepID=UPI0022578ADB|nr:nitroreductase [Streptomyces sp. NBC_01363]MCX4731418.1 nitroreductase [Streptomyces sp. NBC_01363]
MSTQTLTDAVVTDLVADATAAPSMHNAQPWLFRYGHRGRTLVLLADFERRMPEADPSTRALHVGCGAALLNLRVSAAHHGLDAATTLLPEPSDPVLLASVRLDDRPEAPRGQTDEALRALHPAIADRHTSRYPFDERALPDDVRARLVRAARAEGADLVFLTEPHLETVLDLIRDAEGYDRGDPAREAEQEHWTRYTKTDAPVDGIPDYAFGPRDAAGRATNRDFAGTAALAGRARVLFEHQPQLALLSTEGDRPADWLRAGQALERVLLTATLDAVSTSFATQPLEWPDLRWVLRDPVHGTGNPQMIIRLGYGPTGPRTPRRPLDRVLTIEP